MTRSGFTRRKILQAVGAGALASAAPPGTAEVAGDGAGRTAGAPAIVPIGLAAARRAVAVSGQLPAAGRPLVVQLVPPSNLAVGAVPWGLAAFVPADSYREISTATPATGLAAAVSPDPSSSEPSMNAASAYWGSMRRASRRSAPRKARGSRWPTCFSTPRRDASF